jgi:UPF0755 protein
MLFAVEIILAIAIILFFYLNTAVKTDKIIHIPQGSIKAIVTHLSKEGYDINDFDSFILRLLGSPQSGWIDMGQENLTRAEFLYRLTKAKAATREITFIPGDTTYVILDRIAAQFGLNREKLQAEYDRAAPYPEGVIVPDTYRLPIGFDESRMIGYTLSHSLRIHRSLGEKYLRNYTHAAWFRVITIASIIEKEAANREEMPLVSSVIYNRLERNMRLQMDGTLNYGEFSNQKVTSRRIDSDTSLFNTYKRRGLPPYPVSIVSNEAITAALFPTKSNYLYFVKNKTGVHTFSETYRSHVNAIKNGKN